MAQMIPLFLAKDEEKTSSMVRQRVFRDLNGPLDCYDDLELVRRLRFSRASISQITELIANYRVRHKFCPIQNLLYFHNYSTNCLTNT